MLQNFKRLADNIDVTPLLEALIRQPSLWGEIKDRQTIAGSPHKYTEAIFLRWSADRSLTAAFSDTSAIDYPAYEKLPEAKPLIDKLIQLSHGTELGRVLIVNLEAGGSIEPHADEGASADYYERFHIPLMAIEGNNFFSELEPDAGEFVSMKAGEAWWFNHKAKHWVYNGSNEARIHLIADIRAPLYRKERDGV